MMRLAAMRADNSACLRTAAHRRSQATLERAEQTLRLLTATGEPVTIARFAAAAQVSRSWLYTQPELLAKITALPRPAPRPASAASAPASQRASTASLQRRLELAHQRIRQLNTDNQRLRAELARAYGQMRTSPPPDSHQ